MQSKPAAFAIRILFWRSAYWQGGVFIVFILNKEVLKNAIGYAKMDKWIIGKILPNT